MRSNRTIGSGLPWGVASVLLIACGVPAPIRPAADGGDLVDDGGSLEGDGGAQPFDGGDGGVELDGGETEPPDAGQDWSDGGALDACSCRDAGPPPTDGGLPDPVVVAADRLQEVADAYRAFYSAELRWPRGSDWWDPRSTDVGPAVVTSADTALFAAPSRLPVCSSSTASGLCWQGPFLDGTSLAEAPWLDPWGQPIRYALIAVSASGLGSVVLWSIGADGIDQTGCTTPEGNPSCVVDSAKLVSGVASDLNSDDVAVVIAPAFDPVTSTQLLVGALSGSFRAFHSNTDLWPFAGCGWDPVGTTGLEVAPTIFTPSDDVLATAPNAANCAPEIGLDVPSGWAGPYVWSDVTNLATGPALDGWGNPLMYALIRPFDGGGGGVLSAPNGAVLIWSTGPDGIDQTGCFTGACAVDYALLVQGLPSGLPSDDIIEVVGPAVEE